MARRIGLPRVGSGAHNAVRVDHDSTPPGRATLTATPRPLAPNPSPNPSPRADFARALLIAVPAGTLCAWLKTPLPWMIGPLLACALTSGAGARLACPLYARYAGQWAIGTALGLYFTPQVVARLAANAWPVAVAVAWALLVGFGVAWSLHRFAKVDVPTAFFAGAIGGASEMALQGERNGGRIEQIAAAHSLRIIMVVVMVPFLFRWLGIHGDESFGPGTGVVDAAGLAALVAITAGGAVVLRQTRSPNVWVIGPLLAGALVTAAGVSLSAMPGWLVNTGQVFIGISLGTRFRPGFFQRSPRFMVVVFVSALIGMIASALFGVGLGALSGIAPATMVLATSMGGIAEMSLTARVLQLGVPVVTTFHVARMVTLVLVGGTMYRWLAQRYGWPHAREPVSARHGDGDD